jgi:hypothetical protein
VFYPSLLSLLPFLPCRASFLLIEAGFLEFLLGTLSQSIPHFLEVEFSPVIFTLAYGVANDDVVGAAFLFTDFPIHSCSK